MTGKELKALRETLGLSQKELARRIGRSESFVISAETGRRPITAANEFLIIEKTKDQQQKVKKLHEQQNQFKGNVEKLKQQGFSSEKPGDSNFNIMMAVMANATTSSVTLDLVCEVLSKVSGQDLKKVQERASRLAQERGQKLSAVLDVLV